MKPETEILLSTAFALTPKENWTRRKYARDDMGRPVCERSMEASCFCVLGALTQAVREIEGRGFAESSAYSRATYCLRRAIRHDRPDVVLISSWNDRHTHAEVLDALYRAAEIAETQR